MSHPFAANHRFSLAPSVRSDMGIPGKMLGMEEPSCIFLIFVGDCEGFWERRPRIARWWREWPMLRLRFEGSTKREEIMERDCVG